MQCEVHPWSARSSSLREAWSDISSQAEISASPCFTWEFFESVAGVRDDVEVVVFRNAGEILGCFPFQRIGRRRAIPVGGLLNDLHGPFGRALEEDFSSAIRLAGLTRFDFHAAPKMPCNSAAAMPHELTGYRAQLGTKPGEYVAHLMETRYSVRQQKRKTRAMEKKLGPIRVEWNTRDDAVLETLLSWKSQQYQRTGSLDIFSFPWARNLVHRILHLDPDGMHGQMSALYAGDELVAIHLAMRYRNTLHCWFPAYSMQHCRMSPGTELFLRMAARAPGEGVTSLDMASGIEPYKEKFTNETYTVTRGSLDLIPWRSKLRSLGHAARNQAKRIPGAKRAKQWVRQAVAPLNPNCYP